MFHRRSNTMSKNMLKASNVNTEWLLREADRLLNMIPDLPYEYGYEDATSLFYES